MIEPPGPHDPNGKLVQALSAACPSFDGPWRDHLASSGGLVGPYVDSGAFANHLVQLLENNDIAEFPAVFESVERLLIEGDPGIRYLVTFGLIESIQNVASNRHGWPFAARFRPWLGPNTANAWDHVHRVWGTTDE